MLRRKAFSSPLLAASCAALVALATLACGGGTDIAPSQPVVAGQGSATVLFAGLDLGATSQVDAGVDFVQAAVTSATDEVVTFGSNGFARLDNGSLRSPVVNLTGPGGTPTYLQGTNSTCVNDVPPCDFWLEDAAVGLLQARTGGPIPLAPGTVLADYTFNARLLTLVVGLTYPSGQFVRLTIYHVPAGAGPILSTSAIAASAPLPPFPVEFNATVLTNLTTLANRRQFDAADDPGNLLTLTQLDLSDEADPCVGGDVTVLTRDTADPTRTELLDASFESPGC